jgi:hypothetical protein
MNVTRDKKTGSMEERLARIGERVDSLMSKVHEVGADTNQHVRDLIEDLSSSVDREVSRIEVRMRTVNEEVGDDISMTRTDVIDSVREELALWRGRIEGLRLQAILGKMEVDDRLRPALERLEIAYGTARRRLHELSVEEMSWEELEPQLQIALKDLREEFDRAGAEALMS